MNRHLDGIYFRVKRGENWENVCFSDLTPEEREDLKSKDRSLEWWKNVACVLADALKRIGDEFGIMGGSDV